MRNFLFTPTEIVACLWLNRGLIRALTKREILGRYRGSALGLLWSIFNPLFMLTVYTIIFSEVFKARWGVGSGSKGEFALILFAGLIVFNLFADCISQAPRLIIANPNYVKKVVFPLEILPVVGLLSALYHALISFSVWMFAYLILFGMPHATAFLLPIAILPFALFVLGLSWALASLGVFLRDISQLIGVLITALMFISPIFYPATALPENYRPWLYGNPLTPAIEFTRDLLYWGKVPDPVLIAIYWAVGTSIAWLGFAWFQKTKKGFADVL